MALHRLIDALYPGQIRTKSTQRAHVDKAPDRGAGPALARRALRAIRAKLTTASHPP